MQHSEGSQNENLQNVSYKDVVDSFVTESIADCQDQSIKPINQRSLIMTRTTGRLAAGVDELDSEDRIRVLGVIDQFRELGVNEDISLPQVWISRLHFA